MKSKTTTVTILLIALSFTAGMAIASQVQNHPATDRFGDLAEHPWAWDAIDWVATEGLICGVAPGYFAPARPVTRAQFATILHRLEHPDTRPVCPPAPPPTTLAPGASVWEDTTNSVDHSQATLYAINQPKETASLEVYCYPGRQWNGLKVGIGFAFGHINWAEVRRDEDLEVEDWWRWAFFDAAGNRMRGWSTDWSGGIGSVSRNIRLTRQVLDLLQTADQFVVEVYAEASTEDRPYRWRPDAYTSGRAVFDLPQDSSLLQATVSACFPPASGG